MGLCVMFVYKIKRGFTREELNNMAAISLKVVCQDCNTEQYDGDHVTCDKCIEKLKDKADKFEDEILVLQDNIERLEKEEKRLQAKIEGLKNGAI